MDVCLYELISENNRPEIVYATTLKDKKDLKEIEKYAKENNLEVGEEIKSYSPAMLLKYYKWVGSGNNPCVVSRPWKYNK